MKAYLFPCISILGGVPVAVVSDDVEGAVDCIIRLYVIDRCRAGWTMESIVRVMDKARESVHKSDCVPLEKNVAVIVR